MKLRHKDKVVRCRFFVVPGYTQALLGIPEIELHDKLKIMCDVIEGQHTDRKFDPQTMKPPCPLSCKANTDVEYKSDNADVVNNVPNMADYFRLSINREADKKASQLIMQKIHNIFSNVFEEIGCFEGIFKLQAREGSQPYQAPPRQVTYMLQ